MSTLIGSLRSIFRFVDVLGVHQSLRHPVMWDEDRANRDQTNCYLLSQSDERQSPSRLQTYLGSTVFGVESSIHRSGQYGHGVADQQRHYRNVEVQNG